MHCDVGRKGRSIVHPLPRYGIRNQPSRALAQLREPEIQWKKKCQLFILYVTFPVLKYPARYDRIHETTVTNNLASV